MGMTKDRDISVSAKNARRVIWDAIDRLAGVKFRSERVVAEKAVDDAIDEYARIRMLEIVDTFIKDGGFLR